MSRVQVCQAEAILKIAPRGTERRPRPEGLNRLPHIVEAFRDLASYTSRGGVALPTRCFPAEPYFFASPRDPKCKINLTAILAAILACYSRILPPSGGSFLCACVRLRVRRIGTPERKIEKRMEKYPDKEFYYIQMEKYARQAVSEGVKNVDDLRVGGDSEIYRVLNLHYNRNNHIE
ncbi:unnamed protein product, partial [Heterotrigona itama]